MDMSKKPSELSQQSPKALTPPIVQKVVNPTVKSMPVLDMTKKVKLDDHPPMDNDIENRISITKISNKVQDNSPESEKGSSPGAERRIAIQVNLDSRNGLDEYKIESNSSLVTHDYEIH